MLSSRALRAVVASLVLGVLVAPSVASARGAPCAGVRSAGPWTTIQGPAWSDGEDSIRAHAADPRSIDHLYVTNGEFIARSTDGGCKWKETFGSDRGIAGVTGATQVRSLFAPKAGRAVALAAETVGGAARARVFVSEDGGNSWAQGGGGLPPAGAPKFMRMLGDLALLGVDVAGGAADLLYISTDGGRSFSLQSDLSSLRVGEGLDGIEFDAWDPNNVWGYGPSGLYRSGNMGRSFSPLAEFTGQRVGPIDVYHGPNEPAKVIAFLPDAREFQVSRDDGETWFRNASPGGVDSVAHGVTPEDVVVTASGSAYRYHDATYFFFNLDAPRSGLRAVTSHHSPRVTYIAHTDETLELFTGPVPPPYDSDILDLAPDVSLNAPPELISKESKLAPDGRRIALRAGRERTITYTLDLAERQLPLDVYFLMDTSDSMDSVLVATAEAMGRIYEGLNAAGLDVEFGLAEHKAYPDAFPPRRRCTSLDPSTPVPTCEHNVVYQRRLPLPAAASDLEAALRAIRSNGGGIYDSQLGALYQAATGDGQDLFPSGPSEHDVPAGQQAVFRQSAAGMRVVIHPTDEAFGTPESGGDRDGEDGARRGPPPEIPSFDDVIGAMNGREMKYIGIAIGDIRKVRHDQRRVAQATGTLAPAGGVDCTGDGRIDVGEGDPLVCSFGRREVEKADNLVDAIVSLLNALPNRSDVALEVQEGAEVVQGVEPRLYPAVNLQSGRELSFDVTYRCSRAQRGERFDVKLTPATDLELDLGVETRVVCKEGPAVDEPLLPAASTTVLVGLVAPPPPPPPPPATQLSTASQMQAQAQGQAQGAAAHQEEEQPQFAFATSFEQGLDEQLAMSRYDGRRGTMPPGPALGAGVVALALMASVGTALARREKVQRAD